MTLMFRAAVLAAMAMVVASPASAQTRPQQASFVNRVGTEITYLFVTPATSREWGPDRLGSGVLAAGATHRFRPAGTVCAHDVRAVTDGGVEITRFSVDLCRTREVVLDGTSQSANGPPPRPGPIGLYVVRNAREGNQAIAVLQMTPEDGGSAVDVLGVTTLASGQQYTGRVQRGEGNCRFTVVADPGDTSEDNLGVVDLCRASIITIPAGGAASPPAAARAPGAAPVTPVPGAAQETLAVTIRNEGSITIQVINIRPSGTTNWGPDRLGSDVIPAGRDYPVSLQRAATQCAFDVRITYDGGQTETRERQDLCQTAVVALSGPAVTTGRGQAKARMAPGAMPPETSEVVLENRDAAPITQLYISSSRVSFWGDDLLDGGRIAAGARHTQRVERDGQCNFDVRVVYDGGREETRMRQNICQRREIVLGGAMARKIDGGGPANGRPFVFVNDGRYTVRELYMTPVADTHWGDDRLSTEVLPRRFRFELRAPQEQGCEWDLRIVYEDGFSMERRGQNLCDGREISLGRSPRAGTLLSTGTGFYISAFGHVLTNQHVIEGCPVVSIARDGRRVRLRVLAEDEAADLALLWEEGATSQPIPLRGGAAARPGEPVVLIGYPARGFLGGVNVTEGIISGLRGPQGDQRRFQYTAPTQPGNSGGPVIDETGRVIGVVVSQIDKFSADRNAQNINFGVTLDEVRRFLRGQGMSPTEEASGVAARPSELFDRLDQSVVALDCTG